MKGYVKRASAPSMLALLLSMGVALAQEKAPGAQRPEMRTAARAAKVGIPDAIKETVKLRSSLTADQVARIQAIVKRFESQLKEINSSLPSPRSVLPDRRPLSSPEKPADDPSALASQAAATAAKLGAVTSRFIQLQKVVDAEVGDVLTSSQREGYNKTATALLQKLQNLADRVGDAAQQPAAPGDQYSSADCWYGAYYGSLSGYYAWYAYTYGYYDYYYYGNTYAYYDYVYGYYANYYVLLGLQESGGAYFDSTYGFGYDSNSWGDAAYSDNYYAYQYQYYQLLYGYYSYYYYGSAYGYYAYYYGYYAYGDEYYATTYCYYCS